MGYAIQAWKGGRWVIVADEDRKVVICDSREQAQRLLQKVNARENPARGSATRPTNSRTDSR